MIAFHNSPTFMDYLHGDVNDTEAWVACRYEYARESKDMWNAAKERDALIQKCNCSCEKAALLIVGTPRLNECGTPSPKWYQRDFRALTFLCCKSFPAKDWKELTMEERDGILRHERRKPPPLLMPDVRLLVGRKQMVWAIHKKFKELADKIEPVIEEVPPCKSGQPMQSVPARALKGGSVHHCLFEIDFSESPDHLSDRFLAWLNQPAIEQLWQEHKKARTGKIGKPLRNQKNRQHRNAVYYCLFDVNLSARKGELAKQFKKWLTLPENRNRLKRYGEQKRGKTGEWHDRLKDLAAWRLCREIANQPKAYLYANEFADRHRKTKPVVVKKGEPVTEIHRPFRDAKPTKIRPANKAQLFSDESEASDAAREAKTFLADWIPNEFKEPSLSPEMEKTFDEFCKREKAFLRL